MVPIIHRRTYTGDATPLVARVHAPLCSSLVVPHATDCNTCYLMLITQNPPLLYCHGRPGTVLGLPTDLKPTLHTELVQAITTMGVVGGADAEEPATSKRF